MDITSLLLFITGGSLVATLIMGVAKKLLKDISDRWGALATQVVLFVVCLLVSVAMWALKFVPADILAIAIAVFSGAITIYEVFYKAIFQGAIQGKST